MAPAMLEELCKEIQHCCATLGRSRNNKNVGIELLANNVAVFCTEPY